MIVDHVLHEAVQAAVAAARTSPCAKSRRGVAIIDREWHGGRVIASASNGPPAPMGCTGEPDCRAACPRVAVHAEQRALLQALALEHQHAPALDVVHAKVGADGVLVAGGGPACVECSKLMLVAGVRRVFLYEAFPKTLLCPGGLWISYDALDFHARTLAALGLPTGRPGQ